MRNHEIQTQSTEERQLSITAFMTAGERSWSRVSREKRLSDSEIIFRHKVSSRESGLTQSTKKLLAHVIFVGAFLLLPDVHPSMWILLFLSELIGETM